MQITWRPREVEVTGMGWSRPGSPGRARPGGASIKPPEAIGRDMQIGATVIRVAPAGMGPALRLGT